MTRAIQTRTGAVRLAVLALAMTALSACEEGAGSPIGKPVEGTETGTASNTSSRASRSAQRDVEAPDVFEVTANGLWDGRPSLGGIWIAHPEVKQPERVIIRNTKNNKSTVGALFRREREFPGPVLQISSDAAEALGMLAGAPTQIHAVALRREEIKPEPPVAKDPETSGDDTGAAAAATAAKKADPAKPKTEQATASAKPKTQSTADATAKSAETPEAEASAAEKPRTGKWPWQRKPKTGAEITTTTLDPIADAAAAIDAAEPGTSAQKSSAITKPFVQVGTFYVEDNANTAAETARKGGLKPQVRSLKQGDKTVWRVLVGPASDRAERKELLAKATGLGFSDAFAVKN